MGRYDPEPAVTHDWFVCLSVFCHGDGGLVYESGIHSFGSGYNLRDQQSNLEQALSVPE